MAELPEKIGPYKIVAPLGAGGMGQVYRAHDDRLNRDVALKLLPPEFSSDPSRRQRFEQEARAVAALNHPGIVSLYDVGEGWMVTELVDGENLRHVSFTTRQVIDIGAQLADALAVAHEAGIAHRDLKPENVLVTADGRTKILDFGLAKVAQPLDAKPQDASTITNPGSPLGTPGYMAPEQVRGLSSDYRADIFSLGVILYELLAGHPAFQGDSAIDVMHSIVHQDPTPLPETVAPGLRAIIERCLEKKPSQRFQSARDLAFSLRALSGSVNGSQALKIPGPRRNWLLPATAAIALLATGAAAYLYWQQPPAPTEETISMDNYRFTPFAFTRAQEHSGVWSPDGQSVAFVEQSSDGSRLMVQSTNATGPTELVSNISTEPGQLAWSQDGTRVYYLGIDRAVHAVSRAGGAPESVFPNPNTARELAFPNVTAFHVSRDGKHMALWRGTPNGEGSSRFSVWISSPPGSDPVEYTPHDFAVNTPFTPVFLRFSPDDKLLYLSQVTDSGPEMWLLPFPAGSGAPRRIFADMAWSRPVPASWMPDSQRLVISGNTVPNVSEQLWIADIVKNTVNRLVSVPQGGESSPSVTPGGRRVLFSQVQRDRDITEFPLDGSDPYALLSTSLPEFGATWSPKGDQMAYVTQRRGSDELWVRSREGNWERPLVTRQEFRNLQTIVSPTFSPDGTRIAYTAMLVNAPRRRSLAISPVGGGEPTVISDGYGPTWSPDGSTLAFLWLKPDGNLPVATLRVGSDDPPKELVTQRASGAPEWSPDGKWIAVPSVAGVELVSPDGSAPSRRFPAIGSALLWSLDSTTLYGLTFQSAQPALSAINIATGAVKKIADYDLNFQPLLDNTYTGSIRLSMSPGGKAFVTSTATNQADLWILDWGIGRGGGKGFFGGPGGFGGKDGFPGSGPKGDGPPVPFTK